MKDERKTKKQLIEELNELRQQAIKQGSSETKLAGNALIESEARIQSIFRAAPTGIGLVSNRIILEVNDKLCEMLGYSRDELIGKKSQILYLSDEDYEWVGQEKYKQIQEHGTGTVEIRWKRKDGKTIEVILSSTPLDLADLSLGVTFSALDISERVQAEEELGESEKRYNSLVKNSPLGILSADREGNILAVNPAIINMLGSPSYEKTVEINLLSFPLLVEVGFADDALRCMESITTINTECQYITAWGKEVFFKYHLTPLLEGHDLVIGFQAIFEDITERKQAKDALQDSEERFRTLSQATFEGIVISEGGVITDANQQIADILGYDQSDLIGIRIEEYVAPEDFDFVQKHVLMGSETSYEHQALHKDGSSVILEVHPKMMEIRGKKNRVAAVRDITSRKKAENLLVESRNYLNSILDGMGEGLMVVDLNYEITDVNSSFSKNYAKSKEELIGKKCYEITHQLAQPCNTSKHKCPLKQVVSTKTPLKVDHLHHSPVKIGRAHV